MIVRIHFRLLRTTAAIKPSTSLNMGRVIYLAQVLSQLIGGMLCTQGFSMAFESTEPNVTRVRPKSPD